MCRFWMCGCADGEIRIKKYVIARYEAISLGQSWRIPALGRGRASYFCRHKSNQKGFQQKCFFAAQGLCPAKRAEPRAAIICPTSFAQAFYFCKTCYAPAAAQGHHCSALFTRSCSADGEKHILKSCHPERSEGFVLRLE